MNRLSSLTTRFIRLMLLAAAPVLVLLASLPAAAERAPAGPRLVLQITVDQLRGDLPMRYESRLGDGGFRYLWENGAVFIDAHHAHANTETIVGHATLATGAHPATHGMIGNVWFDRDDGEVTYNIEDARYRLLTAGADVDKSTEIDPTQRAARSEGRSPAAILVTTVSDELAVHSGGRAKIFGVSVKDRGAVALAGHAGKAFWFSKASGEFVTSSYYYENYPDWVVEWNATRAADRYAGQSWELMNDISSYMFGGSDDRPWETDVGGFGRTFPHPFGKADGKYFTTLLTVSPAGDRLTLDFAKELLVQEQIGKDEVTDYLSVSFSSTDYVGHLFGPSSLEAEDNILRLDRTLADLLEHVDRHVGLTNTLIVLSADHGGPETPGFLNQLGLSAGYVNPEGWQDLPAIKALEKRFNVAGGLIDQYAHPYLYLNRDAIREQGLDQAKVEDAVVAALQKLPAVAVAVGSSALHKGRVPDNDVYRSVQRNHYPRRSGDIFVVFQPGWFINDFDGLTVAATHGSPWRYDTYVPLVFAGPGIKPQRIARRVYTVDLAATLASYMGTKPPSGTRGEVLVEVLEK